MRTALFCAVALGACLTGVGGAHADDPLVDKVRSAIERGKSYLFNQPNWEQKPYSVYYEGAQTSLAVMALLNAGVSASDERIQKALDYLHQVRPSRTYVVGLQTMAFSLAGRHKDKFVMAKNVEWLLETQQPTGWGYSGGAGNTDNSNSQYALLGLHAAIEAKFHVDRRALMAVRQLYLRDQHDGGWSYRPGEKRKSPPTLTMTTAGLCSLLITEMDLEVGKQKIRADGSVEHCGVYDETEPTRRALDKVAEMLPVKLTEENATEALRSPYYAFDDIERAGRLSGRRFFGDVDWYESGCKLLVSAQNRDGSWPDLPGNGFQANLGPFVQTCFALLFLSKGRTPVLLTKLAYGGPQYNGWNNKHNDLRHLADFASTALFRNKPMAWQIFDVRGRNAPNRQKRRELARQLLQSPVVYFNGHDRAPSGAEEEILKEYLDNGGFVFAEACCGSKDFDRSFRALMKRLFRDSELQEVPADHPVWTASGKLSVPPGKPFKLLGIQHGRKWVVMYSPQQMAAHWEANDLKSERGRLAFRLMGNVIAYATGLVPPRPRLTEVVLPPDKRGKP